MPAGISKSPVKSASDGPNADLRKTVPQRYDRLIEEIAGDIDRYMQPRRFQGSDQNFGLDARSCAVFDQGRALAHEGGDLGCVQPQDAGLDARR